MILPVGFSALAIELPPSQRTGTGFEPVITYQRSTLYRNQEYVIANRDTFVFTNDTLPRVYAPEHDVDPDMVLSQEVQPLSCAFVNYYVTLARRLFWSSQTPLATLGN